MSVTASFAKDISRRRARWMLALVVVLCVWQSGLTAARAASKVFPIQEFEQVRDKWVGFEVTVEGRRTVYDPALIKLKKSTMIFKPQGDLPMLLSRTSNLRLTGSLEKQDGRMIFVVRKVEEGLSDLEQYDARERELQRNQPQGYYELADWVEQRGKFYDDSALLDKARESRRRGFDLERKLLTDKDAAGRMVLAKRTEKLGIADTVRQELIHEAYIIRRDALLANYDAAAETQLLEDVSRDLPGSLDPLPTDNPSLRQRYLVSPVSVYAAAKPAERPVLHRLLWSSLELQRLERKLTADFQNGFEVAKEIDERLPEFHARAETYRDKMLRVRASNVTNMSRSEVLKLRQDYRDRQQPKLGEEAVEAWLQWRKRQLREDDLEGFLNLADQYEELLNQRETKLRMLMDLASRHPESREVIDRLNKLGYRRHGERWITEQEFLAIPQGRLEQALQQGRVEIGMTAAQVQKSMGVPLSLTRIGTRGIVNEVWSYQNPGSKEPIIIYLTRRLPSPEATVVGVDQLP